MSVFRPRAARISGLLAASALLSTAVTTTTPAVAVSGPEPAPGAHAYAVRLDIGNTDTSRACTGALIDPYWVITAASCFADNPAQPTTVPAGPPALKTTATVGRTDLTTTTGQVRDIAELVPRTDRDLVLARLATPVTDTTPLAVATTAPATGEDLLVTGYGRTKAEWVPDKLHSALFTIGGVDPTGLAIAAKAPADAAVCQGDTGGPALRKAGDHYELAALNSRSWQNGCLGAAPTTRTGAYETRTDDLGGWIQQAVSAWSAVVAARSGGRNTVYNPDTRTAETFALRSDGAMIHAYNTNGEGWSGWYVLGDGARFTGSPAVVHNPVTNTLDVFATGTDGSIYRATWSRAAGWTPWIMTADWKFRGSPTTVYNPDTRTAEVFALTTDGTMSHLYNTNGEGWSGWYVIGPSDWKFAGTPAILHNPVTNTLDLFATGTDASMYRATWSRATGWTAWTMTGSWKFGGSPTTVYNPDTRTAEVFGQGTDGVMAHATKVTDGAWSGWSIVGQIPTTG
ncbi:trypsin-like serine protease [Streptomyces noboritoensis]|uniref:Trypsin-like serine protease n=1 Tax=Streptomyces noboritoensis TaxID=67337 RepID=A0ABV6T8Q5_9ACTN